MFRYLRACGAERLLQACVVVHHVTLRCASHAIDEVGGWCKWLLLRKVIFLQVTFPEFEPEPGNTLWYIFTL